MNRLFPLQMEKGRRAGHQDSKTLILPTTYSSIVMQSVTLFLIVMRAVPDLPRFLFTSNAVKYNPVQEDEATEKECICSDPVEQTSKFTSATRHRLCLYFLLAFQSVVSLLVIFVISHRTPSDIACARKLSPYCGQIL